MSLSMAGSAVRTLSLHDCQRSSIDIDLIPEHVLEVDRTGAPARIRPQQMRTRFFLSGGLALIFSLLALLVYQDNGRAFSLDVALSSVVQSIPGSSFEAFMEFISLPGASLYLSVGLVLGASLGLSLLGHRREAAVLFLCTAGSEALNVALKIVLQRPRPTPDLVTVFTPAPGYSFPSGHVLFYVSFFGCLFFLVLRVLRPGWVRAVLCLVCGGMVGLVGLSRVYLGAHWPSDVLAGYLIAGAWLLLVLSLYAPRPLEASLPAPSASE
jgi:membrane-associated phospholipid phosphatase